MSCVVPSMRLPARIACLALALAAASCSDAVRKDEPSLHVEGAAVTDDPTGEAHYLLDFGSVAVGAEVRVEASFVNQGSAPLDVVLQGHVSRPFRSNLGTLRLAPGERQTIWFTAAPEEIGPFGATIRLRTNESRREVALRLQGEGHPTEIACEPSSLALDPVVRGESRQGTVTCANLLDTPTTLTLGSFRGQHHARFDASFDEGSSIDLPGGASARIAIEFAPDHSLPSGPVSAALPILGPDGRERALVQVNTAVQGHALEILTERDGAKVPVEGCHRFPPTLVDDRSEARLFLRNWSHEPVRLEALSIAGEGGPFSLLPLARQLPVVLAPNGAEDLELEVAFQPISKGSHQAQLIAVSDDEAEPQGGVRVCLEGVGGAALLQCFPSQIDFGGVALGTSATRTMRCSNPSTDETLYLTDVSTSAPELFSARVADEAPNGAYAPGEEFSLEVTYRPEAERTDTARLIVESSAAVGAMDFPLVGRGRDLPPCAYEVMPPYLRFGVIRPGTQLTLAATFHNLLDADCIVNNVHLSSDTSPAFEMEALEGVVLPPHGRLPVEVTFAPTDPGQSYTGEIQFSISNPDEPQVSIPLSGRADEPCLTVDPPSMDFGKAPPHCTTHEVFLSVQNTCGFDVSLDDVSVLGEGYTARSVPLLPRVLAPTEHAELSVAFVPTAEGPHHGVLTLDASSGGVEVGPFSLPLRGEGALEATQTDSFVQRETHPKVDFLLVLDNSSGVDRLHQVFHQNLSRMLDFARKNDIDFQIGVTTTGVAYQLGTGCPGGFDGNEDGRLFPAVSEGRPRILRSSMPWDDLVANLDANLRVGVCHFAEAAYEAARRALSPPWITTPLSENGNQGFLRHEAALSILIATDEDDVDSLWNGDPDEDSSVARYVRFFQSLKPSWNRDAVKIHAVSGGETGCTGAGGAMACPRCVEGAQRTGGVWLPFCKHPGDASWEEDFEALSEAIFGRPVAYRLRGVPADQNDDGRVDHHDVTVTVDGRPVSGVGGSGQVWRYDAATNSVIFAPMHRPRPEQVVEVTYKIGCIPPP